MRSSVPRPSNHAAARLEDIGGGAGDYAGRRVRGADRGDRRQSRPSHRRTRCRPTRCQAAIDIPRGARIATMTTASDRLILDLVLPDGGHRIVLIDLASGALVGKIDLRPMP